MAEVDKHLGQSVLTHIGRRHLDRIGVDHNLLTPVQVRRKAVKHLGRQALAVGAAVGVAIGGGELAANSIDNSPTTKYQQKLEQQTVVDKAATQAPEKQAQQYLKQAKEAETVMEVQRAIQLPDDPNIHVG
nr:Unknown Function [uncultured bacterium]